MINDKRLILNNSFYISESFNSIQGEGNCAGALSFFVRFQYCNLTCSWCDSKFSWGENKNLQAQTPEQVKELIQASSSPNIILTGGEPTLYQLDQLVVEGKKYHIETNGTIIPTESLETNLDDGYKIERAAMDENIIKNFNWVVSPKMSNAKQELNERAMQYWASKNYCVFKFIISNSDDIKEINETVKQFAIPKEKVYLGIEGVTKESQLNANLVDEIIVNGYNFSPRLHVLLWGNKRKK